MKERKYTIYYHEFPNGKLYFGQTGMEPEKRWNNGLGYKTQPLMYRAILKYGWENIKHQIVEMTKSNAHRCHPDWVQINS